MRNPILATLCLALAACTGSGDAGTPGPNAIPPDLLIVSGQGQSGLVGTELPDPFVVQATDDKDKPLKGQLVNFVVVAGGGSMFAGSSLTNNDGLAQDFLTLGPAAGQNVVEVRAVDPGTGEKLVFAQFTATGIAPDPVTRFTDEAAFLAAASGAVLTVTFPTSRPLTVTPYVENGVTIASAAGFANRVTEDTPVLSGLELAVSGPENVDITFASSVHAFGLWMQDGYDVGSVSSPSCSKQDSQFTFTFKAGSTVIGTLTEDPALDAAFFLGVILDQPADKLEIREVGSVIGDIVDQYCENDFFGMMFTAP